MEPLWNPVAALDSEAHYLQMMVLDPTTPYLTARILGAAAGMASVWVLQRIAQLRA